jgi:transcriptional regulator with XRE-family HTH domain
VSNNTERVALNRGPSTFSAFEGQGLPVHTVCMPSDDVVAAERGSRLRQCRKAMNWKQSDLAKATGWSEARPDRGLSPSRIANFEQGTRRIGHEEAEALERVFGVPAAYFMAMLDSKEAGAIALLRGLRPKLELDPTG